MYSQILKEGYGFGESTRVNTFKTIKIKPPISGIESFSFLDTPEGKQMTLKAKASMNDECGATASIGASAELLSLPLTLIQ